MPSQDLRVGGDEAKRYFLIGPHPEAKRPESGFGLVVVLPGGGGGANFHPFVKQIFESALPEDFLAAQAVAPTWTADQQIIWPTERNPVAGMKFSTEAFVEALVEEVAKKQKIDRRRVFTLSWSSSGPAAYALSMRKKRLVTGSFIAMSVFKPTELPPLGESKGHPYYLYHSRDDKTCAFRFAEQARDGLRKAGAAVELATYEGGHGWRGNVYADIRAGIAWLDQHRAKSAGSGGAAR